MGLLWLQRPRDHCHTILRATATGLAVYPAPDRLLREALATLPRYDRVFDDTPPSLGLMTGNALAADAGLVPVQAEHLALRGLVKILRAVEDVRARENPRLTLLGHPGDGITPARRWAPRSCRKSGAIMPPTNAGEITRPVLAVYPGAHEP